MTKYCVEWAEESFEECSRYEDRGHNACDDWDDQCCDWWPCSWGCKLITWVCIAWVWISNVVCAFWTMITTVVCLIWEVISIVLTPVAWFIEVVLSFPIIGRLIDEFLNVVQTIVIRIAGLGDAFLGLLGIRPLKRLRLCIIILRDKNQAVVEAADLRPAIDAARQIFRNEANIEIIVEGVHTVGDPSPDHALTVGCNLTAWGEDLWLPGGYFERMSAWHCATGALGRVTGIANQVIAFCVSDIPGDTAGCALGPLTDYLTIEGGNPICLAHEIGHKVGLWHCCPTSNLANGRCGGTQLDWWQILIARDSKYVTYF